VSQRCLCGVFKVLTSVIIGQKGALEVFQGTKRYPRGVAEVFKGVKYVLDEDESCP
jgi:hypothetical protein